VRVPEFDSEKVLEHFHRLANDWRYAEDHFRRQEWERCAYWRRYFRAREREQRVKEAELGPTRPRRDRGPQAVGEILRQMRFA